ncbi:hypothetical protein Zmor_000487 [Zophobas morio]|uniref:BZIP domain-containing protein n=1 Tax=Zophobas morio TaxID=2755281 RepID=A0AA38MRS6_9CUCU|nr:hypothetical protein Zmor_000487 [Zophobas morio]
MVSNPKRMRYVSENFSSSEGEGFDEDDYRPDKRVSTGLVKKILEVTGNFQSDRHSKGKGKWLSKNAIMARENRLKKKIYITNLEKEVDELKTKNTDYLKVVESQSLLISDLKKEIKYLKSVIANSTDIGTLVKNIHQNTGMSVTTSLDQSLSRYVSKPKQPIARKTAHPWEEKTYPSYPTPEPDLALNDSFTDDLLNSELNEFLGDSFVSPVDLEEGVCDNHLKEHNYTSVHDDDGDDSDVGVCLHVSKHRVSLEFCSTCSDNATLAWNN